ncbi:MAG: hypothetical protein R3F31_17340 [Verrucomicrobiales bacterium]
MNLIIKVVNGDGLVIWGDKTTGDEVFISGIEIYEAEVTTQLTPHLEPVASVPQAKSPGDSAPPQAGRCGWSGRGRNMWMILSRRSPPASCGDSTRRMTKESVPS